MEKNYKKEFIIERKKSWKKIFSENLKKDYDSFVDSVISFYLYYVSDEQELNNKLHKLLSSLNSAFCGLEKRNFKVNHLFEAEYNFFEKLSCGWKKFNELNLKIINKEEIKNIGREYLLATKSFLNAMNEKEIPKEYYSCLETLYYTIKFDYKLNKSTDEFINKKILCYRNYPGIKKTREIIKEIEKRI